MFQLRGLDGAEFRELFALSDEELRCRDIRRVFADSDSGFPCRVSLQDAEAGEELLLLPYRHHDVGSPYQAAGPIYVRKGATQSVLAPGEVPPYVTRRLISIRAYDAAHMMIEADVVAGAEVGAALNALFGKDNVSYAHLHNARQGCFSCLATPVPDDWRRRGRAASQEVGQGWPTGRH